MQSGEQYRGESNRAKNLVASIALNVPGCQAESSPEDSVDATRNGVMEPLTLTSGAYMRPHYVQSEGFSSLGAQVQATVAGGFLPACTPTDQLGKLVHNVVIASSSTPIIQDHLRQPSPPLPLPASACHKRMGRRGV